MLVIADAARPLVIAGIMGGTDAEVDDTTTDLLLEVAYFKPPASAGPRANSGSH